MIGALLQLKRDFRKFIGREIRVVEVSLKSNVLRRRSKNPQAFAAQKRVPLAGPQ